MPRTRGKAPGYLAILIPEVIVPENDNRPQWRHDGIIAPEVDDYIYSLLPPRDEVLTHIEAEAGKRKIPIVGPAVGRVLHQLAQMINAKSVFELGSAIGYSTIWWARAVGENGPRDLYRWQSQKRPGSTWIL